MGLNVSKDGDATTSLGNPFQCFATLTVKVFSYVAMEFPVFQFVPPVLPLDTAEKSLAPSSLQPPSGIYRHGLHPPEPSVPEDEQPHLSASPLLTASYLHLCFSLCKELKMGASPPLCFHGVQGYVGRRGLLWPRSPPVLRRGSSSHGRTELASKRPASVRWGPVFQPSSTKRHSLLSSRHRRISHSVAEPRTHAGTWLLRGRLQTPTL